MPRNYSLAIGVRCPSTSATAFGRGCLLKGTNNGLICESVPATRRCKIASRAQREHFDRLDEAGTVLRGLALLGEAEVEAVEAVFGVLVLDAADVAGLLVTVGAGLASQRLHP